MQTYADICSNLESFRSYCREHGVTLVLATKTVPQETLKAIAAQCDVIMGENRVQELLDKYFTPAHWIFIGRLQKNKVKYLVDKVEMICSVDSLGLAEEIEKRTAAKERVMPILIEVNCGEAAKGGVPQQDVAALIEACRAMPHLRVEGLMAVLPIEGAEAEAEAVGALYRTLAPLYGLRYLSMGMSGDYDMAVRHGANMIRIGSAVFGKRS